MIGSSRETVSRAIRELTTQDMIVVEKDTITIRNRAALEKLAGVTQTRRRSGIDRRQAHEAITFKDRREGPDRRSGMDRRLSVSL